MYSLTKYTQQSKRFFWGTAVTLLAFAAPLAAAPDLEIVSIVYEDGTYYGGDPVPFELTVYNNPPSNPADDPNADTANCFRVDIHLTTDGTWNSESDHQIQILSGGAIGPGKSYTIKWDQMMPGNLHGTFFVNARVVIPGNCSPPGDRNGNNDIYLDVRNPGSARITLQPRDFPETEIASVSENGLQGQRLSDTPSISADGRYIAFASEATTLLGGSDDNPGALVNNNHMDIYVRDQWTGEVELLSRAANGALANGPSFQPQISPDGRYVAYHSFASNLVTNDTNTFADVLVFDRDTHQTRRVSLSSDGAQVNGPSFRPSISENGRFVAFESEATNLVSGDTNGFADIFLYDLIQNTVRRVNIRDNGSQALGGESREPRISADGRSIVFQSRATNLDAGNPANIWQVYIHDRDVEQSENPADWDQPTRTRTVQASVAVDASGNRIQLDGPSYQPAISGDGRIVAFVSEATNIHAAPAQGSIEILGRKATGSVTFRESAPAEGSVSFIPDENATGSITVKLQPQAGDSLEVSDGVNPDVRLEFAPPSGGGTAPQLPEGQVRIGSSITNTRDNLLAAINRSFFINNEQTMWATAIGPDEIGIENIRQGMAGANRPIVVSNPASLEASGMGSATIVTPNPGETLTIDNKLTPVVTIVFYEAGTADPTVLPDQILGVEIGRTAAETQENLMEVLQAQIELDLPELPDYLLPPILENPEDHTPFTVVRGNQEVTFLFVEQRGFNANEVLIGATVAETRGNLVDALMRRFVYADLPAFSQARGEIFFYANPDQNTDISINDGFNEVRFRIEEWDGGEDEDPEEAFRIVNGGDIRVTWVEDNMNETRSNLLQAINASILNINAFIGEGPNFGAGAIILVNGNFGDVGNQPIIVVDPTGAAVDAVGMADGTPGISAGGIYHVYENEIFNPHYQFEYTNNGEVTPGNIPVSIARLEVETIGNLLAAIHMTGLPQFTVEEDPANLFGVEFVSFLSHDARDIGIEFGGSANLVRTDGQGESRTPFDGATITLNDGVNDPVTFEFDNDGLVNEENVRVMIGASNQDTRDNFNFAVNQSSIMITAEEAVDSNGEPRALLTNIWPGSDGNQTIGSSGLPSFITVAHMTGGSDLPVQGEAFVLDDGISPAMTFEFVNAFGNEDENNYPVLIGSTQQSTAQGIIDAIKDSGLQIIATHGDVAGVARLIHEVPGSVGNHSIVVLADRPSFEVTGMSATDGLEQLEPQVYVHDRRVNEAEASRFDQVGNISTEAVSVTELGTLGNEASREPSLNADGTYVAFRTHANDLQVRTVERSDGKIFHNETPLMSTTRYSPDFGERWEVDTVVFHERRINNFTDNGNYSDVYVRDRSTGINTRISVNRFGEDVNGILGQPYVPSSRHPTISADGRFLAFASDAENTGGLAHGATNRAPLDHNEVRDIFFHDRKFRTDAPGIPGLVELQSLAGNGPFPVNSGIHLSADVSDLPSGRVVQEVQFFANGELIGTATTPAVQNSNRFIISWTASLADTYYITAVATDSRGRVLPISNVVEVEFQEILGAVAPAVSIVSPNQGEIFTLTSSALITANAVDSDGDLVGVQFYVNGMKHGDEILREASPAPADFPYSVMWSPATLGVQTITAVARDNSGNTVMAAPVSVFVTHGETSPNISVVAPDNGVLLRLFDDNQRSASGTVIVQNGQIENIVVLDSGSGYRNSPTVRIIGNGADAFATATVQDGRVTGVQVVNPGRGYSQASVVFEGGFDLDPVFIQADATASDGAEITSVEFFVNGRQVGGTSRAAPYQVAWRPSGMGLFQIVAVATDDRGNSTTSGVVEVRVGPREGYPPDVTILSPEGGETISSRSITLFSARASDADGDIERVAFYANGVLLGNASQQHGTDLWAFTAELPKLGAGDYTILAVATDDRGNVTHSATRTVTVVASSGAVANPPSLSVSPSVLLRGQSTLLTVQPSSTGPSIVSVRFFANGEPIGADGDAPFSLNWTPDTDGTFNVVAIALDTNGNNVHTNTQVVTVQGNNPPEISWESPPEGLHWTVGEPFFIVAEATDVEGSVSQVEFFVNGVSLGAGERIGLTDFYGITWVPTQARSYELAFRAVDEAGLSKLSDTRTVIVNSVLGGAPTVSIVEPEDDASVTTISEVFLTAHAADSGGQITSVQFFANGLLLDAAIQNGSSNYWSLATDFSELGAGEYFIVAVARDDARPGETGNVKVSEGVTITVTPETGPSAEQPELEVSSPVIGRGQSVMLTLRPDDSGPDLVSARFFANGRLIGGSEEGDEDPLRLTWTPTSSGMYEVFAMAVDVNGNTVRSTQGSVEVRPVSGVAPSVVIVSPSEELTVTTRSIWPLAATATDSDGGVESVEFFLGGRSIGFADRERESSSYRLNFDFRNTVPGEYDLVAVARDQDGNATASAPVAVTVIGASGDPQMEATLTISGGTWVDGVQTFDFNDHIQSQVWASSSEGRVASVEFFMNGVSFPDLDGSPNPVEAEPGQPFVYSAQIVVSGNYNMYAVATDTFGNTIVTEVVPFNVDSPPPGQRVTITSPTAGEKFTVGMVEDELTGASPIPIRLRVDSEIGTITQVEYLANNEVIETRTSGLMTRFDWLAEQTGQIILSARVTSNKGTFQSDAVTIEILPWGTVPGNPADPANHIGFVIQTYWDLLQRAPSAFELRTFSGRLAEGEWTRGQVVAKITTHADFNVVLWVITAHLTVLREAPSVERLFEGILLLTSGEGDGSGDGFFGPNVPAALPLLVEDILDSHEFWIKFSYNGLTADHEKLLKDLHWGKTYPIQQERLFEMQAIGRIDYLTQLTVEQFGDKRGEALKAALILMLLDRNILPGEVARLPSNLANAADFIVTRREYVERFGNAEPAFGPMASGSIHGEPDSASGMLVKQSWFGKFNDAHFDYVMGKGWLKHTEHGWVYLASDPGYPNGMWFWDHIQQDWLWTNEAIYRPDSLNPEVGRVLFSNHRQKWIHIRAGGTPNLRELKEYNGAWSNTWIEVRPKK